MSLCRRLKKKHGDKIRKLAETGISVEAGMLVCGNGKETTTPIIMGSIKEIISPIKENCEDKKELGYIHTHVAPTRVWKKKGEPITVEETEKLESKLGLGDMDWAMDEGLDFICMIRKGKMKCRDMTVTKIKKKPEKQIRQSLKLGIDISNAERAERIYSIGDKKPPDEWFKLVKSIEKRVPKCEIDI